VNRIGARMFVTDTFQSRRKLALGFGAQAAFDPRKESEVFEKAVREATDGRGADIVIVAASAPGIVEQAVRCSRPGSKILLFAQTSHKERIEVSGADICMGERLLCGAYSASLDLQKESARLVFSGDLRVEELISHRFSLEDIKTGIDLALHPDEQSLKIVVQPQRHRADGALDGTSNTGRSLPSTVSDHREVARVRTEPSSPAGQAGSLAIREPAAQTVQNY
jgi:L-iditol 2-dehydrogenase